MSAESKFKKLANLNFWKTIYFNFHYFPLKTAVRLPVFIYRRSKLYKMKGRVRIDGPVCTGMVKFGPHGLGTKDMMYSRTMWEVDGTFVVKGKVSIGRGCKISIGKDATLTLGDKFTITGNTEIICQKEISFGDNCLLSWDIMIMDTDFHHILNEKGEKINAPKPIKIGNHVWIGCRNTILKGVIIPDDNIIAANSTITQRFSNTRCIIGGNGKEVRIIKEGVDWHS